MFDNDTIIDPFTGEVVTLLSQRPDSAPEVTVTNHAPVVRSSNAPVIHHISEFRDQIIGELRLRAEFGDDAAGGELLGFRELDERLNIESGRLIYLGAREGVGKTALALQVARTIALRVDPSTGRGGTVLYAITEMAARQTVMRVIAGFAQVEAKSLRRGVTDNVVSAAEYAFELLEKSGLYIVNVAGRGVDEVCDLVRQFKAEHPDLRAVFVDNLTGVSPSRTKRTQGLHEYIGEIVEKFNVLAMGDAGVGAPVILLGHLTRPERGQSTRRPSSLDIAGSDKVNRWADTIVLLHKRDEATGSPESTQWGTGPFGGGPAPHMASEASHEVLVTKNRDGETFICDIDFIGSQLRFVDPAGTTARPYEMPSPEPVARTEFRRRMAELDDL
jgi:replicative DNA helicase